MERSPRVSTSISSHPPAVSSGGLLGNQHGTALPLIAVFLTAMIAMTAFMMDMSHISVAANEVQLAADIAATAGARAQFARPQGIPLSEAQKAIGVNKVDGKSLANSNLILFQLGNYQDPGGFVPNGTPITAAKATVQTTINGNWMGGFSSSKQSSVVTKTAIAAFKALGSAVPTLPVVLGECHFQGNCFSDSCMPSLTQVPDPTDSSAFTSFFENSTGASNIAHYLDKDCLGDGMKAFIKVGDIINVNNGQVNAMAALKNIKCMVEQLNRRKYLIPIVPCGRYNQTTKVLGFATIIIDQVKDSGSTKGLWLHGIYEDSPGTVGGASFGTGTIGLVQ